MKKILFILIMVFLTSCCRKVVPPAPTQGGNGPVFTPLDPDVKSKPVKGIGMRAMLDKTTGTTSNAIGPSSLKTKQR